MKTLFICMRYLGRDEEPDYRRVRCDSFTFKTDPEELVLFCKSIENDDGVGNIIAVFTTWDYFIVEE